MGNILVFLGFNNMRTHKRGVENVIEFQSLASRDVFTKNYYLHWNNETEVKRFDNFICVGIKKKLFWFITLNIILLKLKRRNKKIFIHSHNPLMSIMSIYKTHLFTVHDALYYLNSSIKHKFKNLFWPVEKLLYFRCNYIHFISNYAKKMSLYTGENYITIPNTSHFESFLDTEIFDTNNKDVLKVFTVRSIEERALINLIVEVAEKLKNTNIEFLIAGKGPLLDFYRMKIANVGLRNITLLGYVPDHELINYYSNCDLVLIPAAYGEGFGLPIIEGYLFNKPVIASNVCAIPEVIITKDFLFENNAESIISKLNCAKEKMNLEYRKHYDNFFSNKVVFLKMNDLYKKLF